MFNKVLADARNGVQSVFEHIMGVTETEFKKLRGDVATEIGNVEKNFESEVASLKAKIAELETKVALKI